MSGFLENKSAMVSDARADKTIGMGASIVMVMECEPHGRGNKKNEQEREKLPHHYRSTPSAFHYMRIR